MKRRGHDEHNPITVLQKACDENSQQNNRSKPSETGSGVKRIGKKAANTFEFEQLCETITHNCCSKRLLHITLLHTHIPFAKDVEWIEKTPKMQSDWKMLQFHLLANMCVCAHFVKKKKKTKAHIHSVFCFSSHFCAVISQFNVIFHFRAVIS